MLYFAPLGLSVEYWEGLMDDCWDSLLILWKQVDTERFQLLVSDLQTGLLTHLHKPLLGAKAPLGTASVSESFQKKVLE